MSDNSALQQMRQQIDSIDKQLQQLLNQRASCALEVAKIKNKHAREPLYYRPEREASLLRELIKNNQGPLAGEAIAKIFREIISACLALEAPLRIAYLGPQGTFTQAAVLKHFGGFVNTLSESSIQDVFKALELASADYGVVPIENSTEGVVNHTLDQFLRSNLQICGEVILPIHHNLLTKAKEHRQIKVVMAHPQALAQCKTFLANKLPHAKQMPVASNAIAAKQAKLAPDHAAIGAAEAAKLYDLQILQKNIEDCPNNATRFLVIGKQQAARSGEDKTSIMLSAKNRPGALVSLLKPISKQGVSMTRIESRPSGQAQWEYVFFIDLEGHSQDRAVKSALQEIKREAAMFKILGSYPKAPF